MDNVFILLVVIVTALVFRFFFKNTRVISFDGISGFFEAYWQMLLKSFFISLIVSGIIYGILQSVFVSIFNFISSVDLFDIFVLIGLAWFFIDWKNDKELENKINNGDIESILKLGEKQERCWQNSDSVKWYVGLGNEYLKNKDYDNAIENYQFAYDVGCKEAMLLVNGIKKFKDLNSINDTSSASYQSDEIKKDNPSEEGILYNVVLTSPGQEKIKVIKIVRELTGLELKKAKNLVDDVPSIIKGDIPFEYAEIIKKQLEEAGATVEITVEIK